MYVNQSIKGPHKATHGQGEATSQQHHRGQQTLRHEVPQAWGAVYVCMYVCIMHLYREVVPLGGDDAALLTVETLTSLLRHCNEHTLSSVQVTYYSIYV